MKQALKLGQALGKQVLAKRVLGKHISARQVLEKQILGRSSRKRAGEPGIWADALKNPAGLEAKLAEEAHFFRNWVDAPGRIGAVSPSGRFLARAMARSIDPNGTGLVVELGPGTGPVSDALIERGIAPERLILVEYEQGFCDLLRRRFPRARVVRGDAYRLADTLAVVAGGPVGAVVWSLPLLNRPDMDRRALLEQAFELMGPDGQFVQFTYGLTSPIPLRRAPGRPAFIADVDGPVWLNLPPARVWRYRRADHYARNIDMKPLPFERLLPLFDSLKDKPVAPALALIRKLADAGQMRR